jgi:Flp pilus assembly protein protease CpaA
MFVELAKEDPGMHLIAGWSMLSVLAVMTWSVATLADSRSRCIVNWVVFPVLLEGAILHFFYMNLL